MSVSYLVWLMFCRPGLKDTLSQGLQSIRYWTSFLPPSDTGGIQDSVMELWVISSATKFLGLEGGSEKLNEIQSTHVKINLRKIICPMYFKLIDIKWVHWKKLLKTCGLLAMRVIKLSGWGQKMYFVDMKTQWSN